MGQRFKFVWVRSKKVKAGTSSNQLGEDSRSGLQDSENIVSEGLSGLGSMIATRSLGTSRTIGMIALFCFGTNGRMFVGRVMMVVRGYYTCEW